MDSTAGTVAQPPPWREVFRGSQGRLIVGLLVLETLFALHFLTVTTVMPAVLDDLGGLSLYGWSATAASLAQLAAIPVASAAVDRYGPRPVLITVAVVYTGGMLITAAAPSMIVVAVGRFFQGLAAGGSYALSLAIMAKALPERHRARVLALLAATWLLPGLLGAPVGGLLASTVGWRWAFIVPLPVLAACLVMILPSVRGMSADGATSIPLTRPLTLMLSLGAFLAAITTPTPGTAPLLIGGAAIAIVALRGMVPSEVFRAKRGAPAAAVCAFFLSVVFAAADYYLPLVFTDVRGRSIGEVSLVIALTPFAWALGSWWQSRTVETIPLSRLMTVGSVFVGLGFGASALGLVAGVPLWVPYAGWVVAAGGMGIAFPIPPLAVMSQAEEGREGSDLSPTLLLDFLGVTLGAGLGGAWLALSDRAGWSLAVGLTGPFVVAAVGLVMMFVVAPRLPDVRRSGASSGSNPLPPPPVLPSEA
jgi:MFS family permease